MKEIDVIDLLKQKFNDDNLFYYYFGIREDYFTETNIRYLNYLLGLKRPDLNLYIWNELMNSRIDKEYFEKFDKSVFTKESLDFLNDYIKAIKSMEHTNLVNLKNTFQTDRLIITAGDKKDARAYYTQMRKCSKKDVDYSLTKYTPDKKYHYMQSIFLPGDYYYQVDDMIHIGFVVKLKSTGEMIGYVQFYQKECYTPEIGYYIFENFRKNGYAAEALTCLLDNLFRHGFKYPARTKYAYVIKEKVFKPSIIRATPNARNSASINLLKKVGFSYSGTSHQQRIDPYTKENLDVDYYYLEAVDSKKR